MLYDTKIMEGIRKREPFLLFGGDLLAFFISLWLALFLRYGEAPSWEIFTLHLAPFAFLFALSILVFFIAGLYEKHTLILKSRLPTVILNAELVNSALAVLFFYLIPYFGIAPKTNLFIYLVISFILILLWRLYIFPRFDSRKKQKAILIGSGQELRELRDEVNNNSRYNLKFISSIDLLNIDNIDFQAEIIQRVYSEEISIIAVDLRNEKVEPLLPHLYNLIFSKVRFIEMHKVYEDIFDRIPLSLVKYSWFLENISLSPKFTYDFLKRLMDIFVAVPLFIVPAITFPFAYIAMKIEDGGEIFTYQNRVGRSNKPITLVKFRTMSFNDDGDWKGQGKTNIITKTGAFLRKTRLDEFPQLWNVLRGDLSLIGPRPEFPEPVKVYESQVPYYNVRHLIKPGLSGWAQIHHERHPHHEVDTTETRNKLSYDLYYIKNRSFFLDLKIALRTIKTLLSRSGI